MSEVDDICRSVLEEDEDVHVFVPKKKNSSKGEYIDSDGVRVVPAAEKKAAPTPEPTRRMEAVRFPKGGPIATGREPTRRMKAVRATGAHTQEPTRRMNAVKASERRAEPTEAVARRERTRKSGFSPAAFFRRLAEKPLVPAAVCAAAVLVLVLVLIFSRSEPETVLPQAPGIGFLDNEGAAHIPLFNGSTVTIPGNMAECAVSPDKKSVVVTDADGNLFRADVALQETELICSGVRVSGALTAVRNRGLIYTDSEGELHRFTFDDGLTIPLGRTSDYAVAQNSLSILFFSGDKCMVLPEDSSAPAEAGGFAGIPKAVAVSDDGRSAVWSDWSNNAQNLYYYYGTGRTVLKTLVGTTAASEAYFSKDFTTVINPDCESVFICSGSSVTETKLGSLPASVQVYSLSGLLGEESDSVTGLYVHASGAGTGGGSVYYLDMAGDREKLLSKVSSFQLRNGTAAFTDGEKGLYFCTVNGATATERVRVAEEVSSFMLSRDGKKLYYMKDVSAGLGILYVSAMDGSEPEKIASDVYTAYMPCENGDSVLFYKEPEETDAPGVKIGVLYLYTADKGSEKLASDTVIGRVSSGSTVGRIRADSFLYLKFLSVGEEGRIYANCVQYDGKNSTPLIRDIYYDSRK